MFKILVVEDDRDLNRTVCAYLNQNGYEAVGCLDAGGAYDALFGALFDLRYHDARHRRLRVCGDRPAAEPGDPHSVYDGTG